MQLAACSTTSPPMHSDSEITIKPELKVYSSAAVEGLKINNLYNAGQYSAAYDQVRIWFGDDNKVSNLFDNPSVTSHALQVCAWKGDQILHSTISRKSNAATKAISAHKAISAKNSLPDFLKLKDYYQCYLRSRPPSLSECGAQVRELVRMTPEYKEIWEPAR
ncbi:hypothetical protein [Zoogloea sp.]|uniref:hypothetical protein n=1 Tax=Zoogloea sp. TaxID=49181 RepID=UPI0035B207FF